MYPDNSDYQKGIHWYTSFDSLSSQFKEYYECKEQVCSASDLETCVMEEMNGSGPTWSRVSSSLNCVDLELSSFQNEITITMQCAVEKNEFLKCVEKLKDGGGYIDGWVDRGLVVLSIPDLKIFFDFPKFIGTQNLKKYSRALSIADPAYLLKNIENL